MYHVEGTDYYLIPTAEVPVTNLYRGEILDGSLDDVPEAAFFNVGTIDDVRKKAELLKASAAREVGQ